MAELTEEEKKALESYFGSPQPEEKHSVHTFLSNITKSKDTTKTGNLTAEEIGTPNLNVRAIKELSLISKRIMGNPFFGEYYDAKSEIITSTSLSKEATLIKLAVIQRREISDMTPEKKVNKGWFKKKNQEPEARF